MDSSCKFPWSWVNVKIQNDKWRFCCKVPYKDYDSHTTNLTLVKESFLNKEKNSMCDSCWIPESKGFQSYRTQQGGRSSHEQIVNFYNKRPSVEWIDIEFGDTCNMSCLTCGPSNSTTWQQILNQYPNTNDKFSDSWAKVITLIDQNLETLDHLNLYGGEPSVDPNFYKMVEGMLAYSPQKPIGVQIYTNGNYSDNHRVKFENAIESLKAAGWDIRLHFSLDAIGEEVEYIRGGLNFSRFEKNLMTMVNKGIKPYVNVTVSILNIENHFEVYNWLLEKGVADKVTPKFNSVSNPREFNLSILGKQIQNFKPNYPDNLINDEWHRFKKILENFVNIKTDAEPDKEMIKRCINRLESYSQLTGKEIPNYYKTFISKLLTL